MGFYEILGWAALGLNVWGNMLLAKKSIPGWLIRLACNFAFIGYSWAFDVWPLLANHIIFAGVNVYGWRKWTRDSYICSCGRKYDLSVDDNPVCICEMPIKTRARTFRAKG